MVAVIPTVYVSLASSLQQEYMMPKMITMMSRSELTILMINSLVDSIVFSLINFLFLYDSWIETNEHQSPYIYIYNKVFGDEPFSDFVFA